MVIMKTEGLTRRFGTLIAVDAMNISVDEGEFFGLLGPNGAGKTTAIKMLTTLLPPTSGTARVGGFDIQREASKVNASLGMCHRRFQLFGEVFSRVRAVPTGNWPYLDFMTPGILAQSVLFVAIFYGIAVIWERDLGIINKFLVSPTPRAALVLGKALSAGVRSLSQAIIIYLLAWLLGVRINLDPLALVGVLTAVILGAASFSTFSLIVACLVKTRERFMGIGQILTVPLFFASNAIYPISIMPGWLRVISRANPLTHEVDALRTLMISGVTSSFGVAGFQCSTHNHSDSGNDRRRSLSARSNIEIALALCLQSL